MIQIRLAKKVVIGNHRYRLMQQKVPKGFRYNWIKQPRTEEIGSNVWKTMNIGT